MYGSKKDKGMALGVFSGLLWLDLGIKQYIEENYDEKREETTKIPGVVLRKFYNKGLIFSSFEKKKELPVKVSLIGTGMLLLADVCAFVKKGKIFRKAGLTLATAGAVSNTYDRIAKGAVVDYIGYRGKNKFLNSLTANLADFYIVTGIMLAQIGGRKRSE